MNDLIAFREIKIHVDLGGDEIRELKIPLNVELLERVEEALWKCDDWGWKWLRLKKSDKTIIRAYEDFCRPYFPNLDFKKVAPDFCMLFFSRVREELVACMTKSAGFMTSTDV